MTKTVQGGGGFSTTCSDSNECGVDKIFTNRSTYSTHRSNFHSSWPPAQCQEPGCSTTVWKSREKYRTHLQSVHNFPLARVNQMLTAIQPLESGVPPGTSALYAESLCLWLESQGRRQFPPYKGWANHYSMHKATPAQVVEYLPTITTRKRREAVIGCACYMLCLKQQGEVLAHFHKE